MQCFAFQPTLKLFIPFTALKEAGSVRAYHRGELIHWNFSLNCSIVSTFGNKFWSVEGDNPRNSDKFVIGKYSLSLFKGYLWLALFFFCGSVFSSKVEKRSHRHKTLSQLSIRPVAEIVLETIIYFFQTIVYLVWPLGTAENLNKPTFSVLVVLYMLPWSLMEILNIPDLAFILQNCFCTSLRLLIQIPPSYWVQ